MIDDITIVIIHLNVGQEEEFPKSKNYSNVQSPVERQNGQISQKIEIN